MNVRQPDMPPAHSGARRPTPKSALPNWERRLWIGVTLGGFVVALVATLAEAPNLQIPMPLFVAGNLVGVVVFPLLGFLFVRMVWRERHYWALWRGPWLMWLSLVGLLGFMEYVLVRVLMYRLAIGSNAPQILRPSVYLLLAIFIGLFALFILGFIVFTIELALRNLRPRRARAPK